MSREMRRKAAAALRAQLAKFHEDLADPANQTPIARYFRSLATMDAEVSLGRVSATVNGFGILKRVRVAPEMFSDLPRLGRLVRRAVNLASNEAKRRLPPQSRQPGVELEPPYSPTPAFLGGAATPAEEERLCARHPEGKATECPPGLSAAQRSAFLDAAHLIRLFIMIDVRWAPSEVASLLCEVYRWLGRVPLSARFVRRAAGIDDPSCLRRFRAREGVSLTEYIRRRQTEVAARMTYRSDLPLEEIAHAFGYDTADAITRAIRDRCGQQSPADLRFFWERAGIDYVLLRSSVEGTATIEQMGWVESELKRMRPRSGGEGRDAERIRHLLWMEEQLKLV